MNDRLKLADELAAALSDALAAFEDIKSLCADSDNDMINFIGKVAQTVIEDTPKFDTALAALRASAPPDAGVIDREEKYLLGHFDADCGIMPGDIAGSFHRIREALTIPPDAGCREALQAARDYVDLDARNRKYPLAIETLAKIDAALAIPQPGAEPTDAEQILAARMP